MTPDGGVRALCPGSPPVRPCGTAVSQRWLTMLQESTWPGSRGRHAAPVARQVGGAGQGHLAAWRRTSAVSTRSGRRHPTPLAIVDPFCDWRDTARRSEAQHGDLRLVVLHVEGQWVYEIYAASAKHPVQAGGLHWWTRADVKAAATRGADLLQRSVVSSPSRPPRVPRPQNAREAKPLNLLDGGAERRTTGRPSQ